MVLRRVMWLIAALLGVAVITSALAPQQEPKPFVVSTDASRQRETALVERSIKDGQKIDPPLRATVGDHVVLSVAADEIATAEIEGLDRLVPVSPENPAKFDFIASRPGQFPVVLRGNPRREVAQLDVRAATAPAASASAGPRG